MPFRWSWIDANWKLDALESQSTKQVAPTVVANSIPHFAFETALHDRLVRNTCVTWLIMIGIGGDLNLQSWSHLLWCRQAQDVDIPGRTQCSTVPSGSEVFGTVSQAWLLSWTACLVKKIVTLHVTQAWADMIYILKSVIVYLHITIREVLEKSSSILTFFPVCRSVLWWGWLDAKLKESVQNKVDWQFVVTHFPAWWGEDRIWRALKSLRVESCFVQPALVLARVNSHE